MAAVLGALALAALWLVRNPVINAWDEVGHINHSLADALWLREGNLGGLRDALFLEDRWLPPGLRLVGLPIAAAFWPVAPVALRISGAVLFVATAAMLWLALRPLGGRAGAAAGVLAFALAPINLFSAQNFMTESVLNLCAVLALWLLALEAQRPRASILRLGLLGPVLGLGWLAKLTLMPSLAPVWFGVAAWRWWQDRDREQLALRLLVPVIGLVLVAWPHYLLNGARYYGYAKVTAEGFGFTVWPETGLDFVARAGGFLASHVAGPGGLVVLLIGLALLPLAWRWANSPARLMAVLGAVAALPSVSAFLLTSNQTDRYLSLALIGLSFPMAVGFGVALRTWGGAPAIAAGVAGLAQLALALFLTAQGPNRALPLRGLNDLSWRANHQCDFTPVVGLFPPGAGRPAIGIYGLTLALNHVNIEHAFLRAGRRAAVVDLGDTGGKPMDWDAVIAEAAEQDILLVPQSFPADTQHPSNAPENHAVPEFLRRAEATFGLTDRGTLSAGASEYCQVRVLAPREPRQPPEAAPRRAEVNSGW